MFLGAFTSGTLHSPVFSRQLTFLLTVSNKYKETMNYSVEYSPSDYIKENYVILILKNTGHYRGVSCSLCKGKDSHPVHIYAKDDPLSDHYEICTHCWIGYNRSYSVKQILNY